MKTTRSLPDLATAVFSVFRELSPRERFEVGLQVTARLLWALVVGVALSLAMNSVAHADVGSAQASSAAEPRTEETELIRLFAWTPFPDSPAYVLPVRRGESPKVAAQKYLETLTSNSDLAKLFEKTGYPELTLRGFKELKIADHSAQSVLLLNRATDYVSQPKRVMIFAKWFKAGGRSTYVLPISADLRLSSAEADAFYSRLAHTFSRMTAMGGHDVATSFYKTKNRTSTWKTPTRDGSEIKVIQRFNDLGLGFFFGTCRGQQLTAISMGYKLVQDIPSEVGTGVLHAKHTHAIEIERTTNSILKQVASGRIHADVNSLHHQSVHFKAGGPLEVAARSSDGTIEALEFKNGKGLLVQFHPEVMENSSFADRIMARMSESGAYAAPRTRTCEASFR